MHTKWQLCECTNSISIYDSSVIAIDNICQVMLHHFEVHHDVGGTTGIGSSARSLAGHMVDCLLTRL